MYSSRASVFQTQEPIPSVCSRIINTQIADIFILKWRTLPYSPSTPRPFYNGVHTRDFPIVHLRHAHSIMASTYHFATGHLRHAHTRLLLDTHTSLYLIKCQAFTHVSIPCPIATLCHLERLHFVLLSWDYITTLALAWHT